jgi:hypothetical protein
MKKPDNQRTDLEALRRQLPYINIYKILNNTKTEVEEKIRLLKSLWSYIFMQ